MKILQLENVSKFYKSAETVSVGMKNVTTSFEIGEFVAITGESGSGKSTLLNVISGLDGYEEGEVYHYGEETSHYTIADWEKYRSAYIGFIFQNYNIIDSYTVYQNVMFALEVQGYPKEGRRKRALELIEKVGLTSHKNHKASKLSGGQKQRTVIARALAKDTPIIVADEPTGNLDSESAKQVMELLNDLSKDKLVIVVTHDYSQVEKYATRKIRMHDGTIVEDLTLKPHEVIEAPVKADVKKTNFLTLLKISFRNVFSMPKRFLFMLVLQILVIGIFTMVYSSQMQGVRQSALTQSWVFINVPESRLLVERRDGGAFTQAEINKFKNNKNVITVYENAHLFYNDIRLGINKVNDNYNSFSISGTDSAVILNKRDVKGELPVAINEVVISEHYGNFSIGDVINIFPNNYGYFDENVYKYLELFGEFKVTGIDKLNRGIIYFSEAYLSQTKADLEQKNQEKYEFIRQTILDNLNIVVDYSEYLVVYDENMVLEYDLQMKKVNSTDTYTTKSGVITFTTAFANHLSSKSMFEDYGYVDSEQSNTFYISETLYNEIITSFINDYSEYYGAEEKNLISIEVASFNKGDKFLNSVDKEIYKVYYPANLSQPGGEIMLIFTKILAYLTLFFLGMFLYTMVHAVSKNIMASRKKDFAIYRSIGTNQKDIAIMVVVEQVILSMIAFVVTLIGLNILGIFFTSIRVTITYMEVRDYLALVGVFLFFSIWLGLRFNKKVFDQSVITVLTQSKGDL